MSGTFTTTTTLRYEPNGSWLGGGGHLISSASGEAETNDHLIQLLSGSERPPPSYAAASVPMLAHNVSATTVAAVGSLQDVVLASFDSQGNASVSNETYVPDCTRNHEPGKDFSFEYWTFAIALTVIGGLGILGNILSIIILSRPQMRSSINYLLIALARCDIILIVTSIMMFGMPLLYEYSGQLFYYYYYVFPHISPYFFPVAMCAQTASIYLTFTVTLERFVAVCHPLRARALCTYGRAKLYVIGCWAFSVLFNLPHFWDVNVVARPFDEDTIVYCLSASTLRENPQYINIYIHWISLVVLYVIPFTTLAILNTLIYRQVRKANRERQRLSRTEKREIGLATMLLCVVLVFLICNVLSMVNNIMEALYDYTEDAMVRSSNVMVTFNSSINFVIYVIFGEKFKRIFLMLFCSGRVGRESPDGLMHDDSSFSGENRCSGRFQRHGTTNRSCSSSRTNGTSLRINRSVRVNRAPSPGPIVYYPAARDTSLRSSTYIPRSTSMQNGNGVVVGDWGGRVVGNGNGNGNGVNNSGGGGGSGGELTTTTTVGF